MNRTAAANVTADGGNETSSDQGCSHPADQRLIYSPASVAVFSVMYASIFAVGLVGNLLVSAAVARSRAMRSSVTNLFILNLAASDVVMCLFAVPFTPLQSFTGRWAFGEALCKLFPFSQVGGLMNVSSKTRDEWITLGLGKLIYLSGL